MTEAELIQLHTSLVEIRSVSHQEEAIMAFAHEWLEKAGLETRWIGRNVLAKTPGTPRLLLNTHLDTVPDSPTWTRDPWRVTREAGRIYGLGSNDAKGSAAAMMACMARHLDLPGLALLLVVEEETGGEGTEMAWPELRDREGWRPEGVIVGEPTGLAVGISQWGLLVLELIASGTACHAAHAHALGATNPIYSLARNLLVIESLELPGGQNRPVPTTLSGAPSRNQVGSEAKALLDIRSMPHQDHAELINAVRSAVDCNVRVVSERLRPYRCPPDARLVQVAIQITGQESFESRTMSDQVFFEGVAAIKCGPGDSSRSHTADEYLMETELIEGANAYTEIAQEFLR